MAKSMFSPHPGDSLAEISCRNNEGAIVHGQRLNCPDKAFADSRAAGPEGRGAGRGRGKQKKACRPICISASRTECSRFPSN